MKPPHPQPNTTSLSAECMGLLAPTLTLILWLSLVASSAAAPGNGLKGEYYNDPEFTDLRLTRTDATLNFFWYAAAPGGTVDPDTFSVRWSGRIVPRYSETYTFTTLSDDGVRLWLDGVKVIDNWTDHPATEDSGAVTLDAGRPYDIVLEYYENGGDATLQLRWSSLSQTNEVVPSSQLHPTPYTAPGKLSVQRGDNGRVGLSWPKEGGANPLQYSSNLSVGQWTTLSNVATLNGDVYSADLIIPGGQGFFRLLQPLAPRATFPKPALIDVDPARVHLNQIVLKFQEGTRVRLRDGSLRFDPAVLTVAEKALMRRRQLSDQQVQGDLREIQEMVQENPGRKLGRMFEQLPESALARSKAEGEELSGEELADLDLYYYLFLPTSDPLVTRIVLQNLSILESVEAVYAQPRSSEADLPPTTTINLVANQRYRDPAPVGIGAEHAWSFPGGRGDGSRVIDIEASWHLEHEDLPGRDFYRNGTWTGAEEHGTAVLGVLVASENSFGITGLVPHADYGAGAKVTAHASGDFGLAFGVPAAILNAIGALRRGDVILVEQHAPGPDSGRSCPCNCEQFEFVPQEYYQADFDAIRAATARGIIVVEAAANGSMNLDSPIYDGRFNRSVRDSGAIMVGASAGGGSLMPACFSSFGSRVDVHGWGGGVATLGYGRFKANGEDERQWYTDDFGGTSSASPIVAGAVCSIQGIRRARGLPLLGPVDMRRLLRLTGTPQANASIQIGPLPNLQRALDSSLPSPSLTPAFSGWQSLGGDLISTPTVGQNADGRLEVFALGAERTFGAHGILVQKWQGSPGGNYSDWLTRPGMTFQGTVAAARNQDGRLEVFGRQPDGGYGHSWQLSPNGNWSAWAPLGDNLASDPAVGVNADGRLEIISRRVNNSPAHVYQVSPNGNWSAWASLGGIISGTPAVARNADGRLESVANTTDRTYWNTYQLTPNGPWAGTWGALEGNQASDPVLNRHQDGRLVVFGRGLDNHLKFRSQTATGGWAIWRSFAGSLKGKPVVIPGADGRLNVFVQWTDNTVRHTVQAFLNSDTWTAWRSLGGNVTGEPAVGLNSNGRLEIFARGSDRNLWQRRQSSPGVW